MRAASKLFVAVLVAGLGFWSSSVKATTIRSSSNYGQDNGFASCVASTGNCESFDVTNSQGTVTLDGLISFNVYRFAFNDGSVDQDGNPNPTQVLDLINLGSLSANQTFTLTSALFGAADLANAQILSCNDGFTYPVDSSFPPQPVNGFCSNLVGTGDYAAVVSNGVVNGQASFTLTANYNLSDLVLEFQPGSAVVSTPEPASLMLVGTGVAALFGIRRRKQQ